MKNRIFAGIIIGGASLFLSGCAMILKGDYETVRVAPEPHGAAVYVNNEYKGMTPVDLNLSSKGEYDILIAKKSYLISRSKVKGEMNPVYLVLDIASGVVPAYFDWKSGAWNELNTYAIPQKLMHWSDIEDPENYIGDVFQLEYLFFPSGSYKFDAKSKEYVDRLVAYLKKVPAAKLEIRGHTDKTGKLESNMKLSRNRAKFVAKYLVEAGISKERLAMKGLGPNEPLIEGDSKEILQLNRRVEFKFIDKK